MNLVDRNRLPLKQYSLICTAFGTTTGWSTIFAKGIPYQTLNGTWRLKFNISGSFSSAVNPSISIAGASFPTNQAISITDVSGIMYPVYAITLAGGLMAYFSSASTQVSYSGDVELSSKPTFVE